jgi:hypothetical protein
MAIKKKIKPETKKRTTPKAKIGVSAKPEEAPPPVAMPEPENLSIAHTWTNGNDEVLILKFVAADGSSYGGFKWPLTVGASVEAPDWDGLNKCAGGLHGWPWGLGIGDGKDADWSATWLVFGCQPEDVIGNIEGGQKCKARRGVIRFVGDWQSATNFVLSGQIALVQKLGRGAASATGWSGAASATGERGAASATGERGAASATGERGAAVVTGENGKAQAGVYGCIALAWWNSKASRYEMRCAETGCGDGSDGKLKANTWYQITAAGTFVEV